LSLAVKSRAPFHGRSGIRVSNRVTADFGIGNASPSLCRQTAVYRKIILPFWALTGESHMSRIRRAVLKTSLVRGSVAAAAAIALGFGSPPALAASLGSADLGSADPGLTMQVSPDFDTTTSDPITLTANFAIPGGAPAPSGTVTFTVDGSTF